MKWQALSSHFRNPFKPDWHWKLKICIWNVNTTADEAKSPSVNHDDTDTRDPELLCICAPSSPYITSAASCSTAEHKAHVYMPVLFTWEMSSASFAQNCDSALSTSRLMQTPCLFSSKAGFDFPACPNVVLTTTITTDKQRLFPLLNKGTNWSSATMYDTR